MHHLVFGINFQIHFVILINPVSIHLFIHLSTHPCHHRHSQHLSPIHSFTRGSSQNLPFQRILPTLTFLLYSLDWLHDNGTYHAHQFILFFFYIIFSFVPYARLSWLSVSFLLHVKYTSYRILISLRRGIVSGYLRLQLCLLLINHVCFFATLQWNGSSYRQEACRTDSQWLWNHGSTL